MGRRTDRERKPTCLWCGAPATWDGLQDAYACKTHEAKGDCLCATLPHRADCPRGARKEPEASDDRALRDAWRRGADAGIKRCDELLRASAKIVNADVRSVLLRLADSLQRMPRPPYSEPTT